MSVMHTKVTVPRVFVVCHVLHVCVCARARVHLTYAFHGEAIVVHDAILIRQRLGEAARIVVNGEELGAVVEVGVGLAVTLQNQLKGNLFGEEGQAKCESTCRNDGTRTDSSLRYTWRGEKAGCISLCSPER